MLLWKKYTPLKLGMPLPFLSDTFKYNFIFRPYFRTIYFLSEYLSKEGVFKRDG